MIFIGRYEQEDISIVLGVYRALNHCPHDVDHRVSSSVFLSRVDHRSRVSQVSFVELYDFLSEFDDPGMILVPEPDDFALHFKQIHEDTGVVPPFSETLRRAGNPFAVFQPECDIFPVVDV